MSDIGVLKASFDQRPDEWHFWGDILEWLQYIVCELDYLIEIFIFKLKP